MSEMHMCNILQPLKIKLTIDKKNKRESQRENSH